MRISFSRRKISLEGEKQQRDADLKIKCGEVQTLQKEYESINSTIQLLEKQRGTVEDNSYVDYLLSGWVGLSCFSSFSLVTSHLRTYAHFLRQQAWISV